MLLPEAADEELNKLHQELCSKLNLDASVTAASWDTFESISKKFVLEGEKLHWLGCAIYVVSRGVETPTLDNSSVVKGMGISLTSLLRHSNLSFVQFFSKISRWSEMAQLPDEFRNKIDNLSSTFSVAYNTFKKFHPVYSEIFAAPNPTNFDMEKHKNRKNKLIPLTSLKVFEFIWNLFITLKAEDPTCSTELIKSFHLLYCCIDFVFKNAIIAEKKELINTALMEELVKSGADLTKLKNLPCMVKRTCNCDSVIKEALHMKVYTFKNLINKLIQNNTLIVDKPDLVGLFDEDNFDQNFRNITKIYDTLLLNKGDFDERIFLAEFKRVLLEKEYSASSWTSMKLPAGDSADDESLIESPKATSEKSSKILDTPLTGRKFLGPRESDLNGKSTSEKVSRLHAIIGDRIPGPSEQLKNIFQSCERDPLTKINEILSEMKEKFIEAYTASNFSLQEAQNKLDCAVVLFYKYIEMILNKEKTITTDISNLVEKNIFYQCMFTCCMEIVLFCYNFPKKFPWILEVIGVEAVHFVKVIELIVRTKDNLFRELIKHLNRIEETVIECLIWSSNSPIWDAIDKSGQGIPKFEDTALPGHLLYNESSNEHLLQSPGPPSASDRFQSPLSQLCRNLFPSTGKSGQRPTTHLVLADKDGKMKLIPLVEGDIKLDNLQGSPGTRPDPQAAALPRRTGSVSIIFRKFYNLAGVRMQHLCSHLGFEDFELRRKIWTIFEDSIRHTDLIKDRHLDQLLMCAIYVICKAGNITKIPNLFTIIMKYYRQQPQALSSVYRDVLIQREQTLDNNQKKPEERGDLILFYNNVYVKVMQSYTVKFQPNSNPTSNLMLSPLPANRKNLASSNLQIVGNVIVKPLETTTTQSSSTFNYYFSRSPSKELMNINRAINGNEVQGKRLLIDDDINVTNKRLCHRKVQSLMEERKRQNVSD